MKRFLQYAFMAFLLTCQPLYAFADETEVIDGVTYDVVTITVSASTYDASKPPVIAPVKYNKRCPLVITSGDSIEVDISSDAYDAASDHIY